MKQSIYTAIVMGSNALKLKIIQRSGKNVQILENISEPIALGNDIFEDFIIKKETLNEIIRILTHFGTAMSTYEVDEYEAVATSAVEKAVNGLQILDIIQMKTGLLFEVLEESMEKGLIYKSLGEQVEDYRALRRSSLLVSVNSGTCDVSIYHRNKLVKNDEIELGTKAMKSLLGELEHLTVNYPYEMSLFINVKASPLKAGIEQKQLKHFVYMGSFSGQLREKFFKGAVKVSKKEFEKLYERSVYDHQTFRKEVEGLELDWYEFLINVLIVHNILSWSKATALLIPEVSLRDGIILEAIERSTSQKSSVDQDAIQLAYAMSRRYKCSEKHIKYMEKTAMSIFSLMKAPYRLDDRDALLLRISAILLDIGKYANASNFEKVTYDRINQLRIIGISKAEHLLVALVCRQLIGRELLQISKTKLAGENAFNTRVNRMAAILGIAYALDAGMTQRVHIKNIKLNENRMKLYVDGIYDMALEEWYFEKAADVFLQTFDIEVELRS
ncbi:MAG: exopolyphosphatase / guanosine-5-triphosphate,3-diphosphate pyrophosphatase [Clostridiales bacterium]|jgi:exopolyphosphatase/guanosine-5'-triphosphate,3'-diphosphate pyrophosphatase|nr:exopolyphosphatase / guanosine-5-triphosphate,3-diphosphate pyrophosphatase [Clostridiales bacterium]MDN5299611.1 exopolyphosphatase / guanosine-5-triphosphate,3-diphosphate pyrophosphatase [Clostridiales bacterium]